MVETNKITFGKYLSQCINDSKVSKETMIKQLKIDRSSFYQYLSSKRKISKSQFRKIYKILSTYGEVDTFTLNELIDRYEQEYLNEHELEDYNAVKSYLNKMNTALSSSYISSHKSFQSNHKQLSGLLTKDIQLNKEIIIYLSNNFSIKEEILEKIRICTAGMTNRLFSAFTRHYISIFHSFG